jgi:hypothetical protein
MKFAYLKYASSPIFRNTEEASSLFLIFFTVDKWICLTIKKSTIIESRTMKINLGAPNP